MMISLTSLEEEDVIAFQDKINTVKDWEKIIIYIKCWGWSVLWKDVYVNMINNLKDVEVVWIDLSSSAYDLFAEVKCKKSLVKSVIWMVHHSSWEITFWKEWPKDEFAKFQVEYQRKQKGYDWLNRKERKLYEKGLEVWLDYDRLIEIFPNAKHE